MKSLLLACSLVLAAQAARADFVIVQKVEGVSQQTGDMTLKIKGEKSRVDLAPQISQIIDAKTGETVTLMHQQKTFLKISAERSRGLIEQMQKMQAATAPTPDAPPKLTPTGEKEKIGTWETEVYRWKAGGMTAKYWVAKDFPNYAAIQAAIHQASGSGLGEITKGLTPPPAEIPGMAVKTEMKVMGRTITSTLISAEEKPVDPKDVEIPANYKELPSPDFSQPPAKP